MQRRVKERLCALLNKKRAFRSGDREELRRVQHHLRDNLTECKDKRKLEPQHEKGRLMITGREVTSLTPFSTGSALRLPPSLQPELWKITCLVPVPKKSSPSGLSVYRPVALTSHVMKVLERLVPWVKSSLHPLQFAPQGTVLSPFLFTLYTTDFQCN